MFWDRKPCLSQLKFFATFQWKPEVVVKAQRSPGKANKTPTENLRIVFFAENKNIDGFDNISLIYFFWFKNPVGKII